jgi:NitT/TauT family transport system permease protein/taurine transport system permease protein
VVTGFTEWNTYYEALQTTMYEVGISLLFAWSLGIIVGIILGSSVYLSSAFKPIFASLFAVPLILLYPIFLAWVGIGPSSKILFGTVYGAFPVILHTMTGVSNVDSKYKLVGRSMGGTSFQIRRKILIPLAIPSILSGLRIGTAITVAGVVFSEMIASTQGLGFVIRSNQTAFNTPQVYFAVILVVVLVILVNAALTHIEDRVSWTDNSDDVWAAP